VLRAASLYRVRIDGTLTQHPHIIIQLHSLGYLLLDIQKALANDLPLLFWICHSLSRQTAVFEKEKLFREAKYSGKEKGSEVDW
tara:strand:- start:43 stop:294 length:252 start_codon:yes stop_codon:yes gene_type:complete